MVDVYDTILIMQSISVALLIRPSWAQEREGAYPHREEVYHVKQGADGSHSEPKGICEKQNH